MLSKYKYHSLVLLAGISWSTLAILTQYATQGHISSFNQVFWRLLFAASSSLIIAFIFFKSTIVVGRKEYTYLLANGFLFFLGLLTFTGAIYVGTPIAKALALNYSYPIAIIVFSYFVFKHIPSRKNILAVVLSLISIVLLTEVWKINNIMQIHIGDLLAWLNSFAYAGIIILGTKIKRDVKINQFLVLFYTWFFSLLFFIPFSLILRQLNIPLFEFDLTTHFSNTQWLILIGLGTISSTLPVSLLYYGFSRLKPIVSSILLLSELVCVYLAGIILFGQQLSIYGIIGMIGIVISVLLI